MLGRVSNLFTGLRQQIVRGANSVLAIFRGEGGTATVEIDTNVLPGLDAEENIGVVEVILDRTMSGLDALQYFTTGDNFMTAADFADNSIRIEGPFLTAQEAQFKLEEIATVFGSPEHALQIKYTVTTDETTGAEDYEFFVWWIPS